MATRRQCLAGLGAVMAGTVLPTRPVLARERLTFRELYKRQTEFSERAQALAGQRIEMPGYMAPPLKPDANFFVLTRMPMAVCPFCDDAADWPSDIVYVRLRREQDWVYFNVPIVTTGILELGVETDERTGFVSLVRLVEAEFERAR